MSAPILTKEAFLNWVKKQNPDTEYNWLDPYGCAICQYARAMGFQKVVAGTFGFSALEGPERKSFNIEGLKGNEIYSRFPKTKLYSFGALAKTLES